MKFEADHLKLGRKRVGVATVGDVLDNRILVQFDGFDSTHDYWADITSPNIHPYNWHKNNNHRLVVAKGKSIQAVLLARTFLTFTPNPFRSQNTKGIFRGTTI